MIKKCGDVWVYGNVLTEDKWIYGNVRVSGPVWFPDGYAMVYGEGDSSSEMYLLRCSFCPSADFIRRKMRKLRKESKNDQEISIN